MPLTRCIVLSPALDERLIRVAHERDQSVSAVVREAISIHLPIDTVDEAVTPNEEGPAVTRGPLKTPTAGTGRHAARAG